MKVYLVWSGEYEQRDVDGVYSSQENAISAIKGSPGLDRKDATVEWSGPGKWGTITATFTRTAYPFGTHAFHWEIQEKQVD